MRSLVALLFLCAAMAFAASKSVYDFTLNSIDGQPAPLAAYKGKVVLIVNVASRCGFTPTQHIDGGNAGGEREGRPDDRGHPNRALQCPSHGTRGSLS